MSPPGTSAFRMRSAAAASPPKPPPMMCAFICFLLTPGASMARSSQRRYACSPLDLALRRVWRPRSPCNIGCQMEQAVAALAARRHALAQHQAVALEGQDLGLAPRRVVEVDARRRLACL